MVSRRPSHARLLLWLLAISWPFGAFAVRSATAQEAPAAVVAGEADAGPVAAPEPDAVAAPEPEAVAEPAAKAAPGAAAAAPTDAGAAGEPAPSTPPATTAAADPEAAKAKRLPPKTVRFEVPEGGVVYWITIDATIDLGLAPYVERVLAEAAADPKAVAVISEINTPGGRVDAAVRIRDALIESSVPTVAFIHSEAISAGALIALAHDYLVIVRGGTIGAATPIQLGGDGGGGAEAVGEKMTSYVRGVFRATAEARDRDPVLAEAMVDASVDVPGLAPAGKLLTATAQEALDWGLVDVLVDGREAMLERTGLGTARIERRETGWAERLARVLTDPVLSGLLMSFGFLGLLMEFYTPGFGVIGAIGLTCLGLFFFGHAVVHLAGLEELLIFGTGIVLLGIELFVTPGFGVLGILGLAGITVSLIMTLIANPIAVSIDTGELAVAAFRVLGSLAVTAVAAVFIGSRLTRSSIFRRRLVLTDAVSGMAVGFEGADRGAGSEPGTAPAPGSLGTASTALRPSGKVRVAGQTYDALTTGDLIEQGTPIEVRGTRGSSLLVHARPAPPPPTDAPPEEDRDG